MKGASLLCITLLLLSIIGSLDLTLAKVEKSKSKNKENEDASDKPFSLTEIDPLASASARLQRQERREKENRLAEKRQTRLQSDIQSRTSRARSAGSRLRSERLRRRKAVSSKKDKDLAKRQPEQKRVLDPEVRAAATERLSWFTRQSARAASLRVDAAQFMEYIVAGPRPYHVILSLTALNPQQQCEMCQNLHAEMDPLAHAFQRAQANKNFTVTSDEKPVFFVDCDFTKCGEIFSALELRSAPTLVAIPASMSVVKKPARLTPRWLDKQGKNRFMFMSAQPSSSELQTWISRATHHNLEITLQPSVRLTRVFSLMCLLGLLVLAAYFGPATIKLLRGMKVPTVVFSFFFYAFCVGGGMYSFQRDVPWSGNQGAEYIARGSMEQYGAEGYILGAIYLTASVSVLLLNMAFNQRALANVDTDALSAEEAAAAVAAAAAAQKAGKSSSSSSLPKWLASLVQFFTSQVGPALLALAFGATWWAQVNLYTIKNWGYRNGFPQW